MITLIWAMDTFWLIGKDNLLPWHHKKDLQFFKSMTQGKTVLMGDMTYHSLKGYYKEKPLPYGKMYVANLKEEVYPDATCITDLKTFLNSNKEELIVIGGRTIYDLSLPFADILYITYVLNHHEGNVYFPNFDLTKFKLIDKEVTDQLIFTKYQRK